MRRTRSIAPVRPALPAGLTLYVGKSFWDQWVTLVYQEKEVDDARLIWVDPIQPPEDLLTLSPSGATPVLADRELLIVGDGVIAEYLDERYPHPRLLPMDPSGRARVRMAVERLRQELVPLVIAAQNKAALKERQQLAEALKASAHWFPAKAYFLGNEFSLADCAWAVWLLWVGKIEGLPNLPAATAAYLERLQRRPFVAQLFSPSSRR